VNPKKLIGGRKIVFVLLAIFAMVAAAVLILIYTTRPVTDVESAGVQARKLIASVGGPAKICDEANQMFKRFGESKEKFLETSELKDYPAVAALAALGNFGGIWIRPDSPPHFSIRVGNHRDGFFIEIADTNSPAKYLKSPNSLELLDSCIFVHR
jgi:hypothetical protein